MFSQARLKRFYYCNLLSSLRKHPFLLALWNIVFSRRSILVLLELVGRWTQQFTKIDQKTRKIGQIYIWNPMTTRFIMKTLICVISMEFL